MEYLSSSASEASASWFQLNSLSQGWALHWAPQWAWSLPKRISKQNTTPPNSMFSKQKRPIDTVLANMEVARLGFWGSSLKGSRLKQASLLWLHPSLSSCLEHGWDDNGIATSQWGQQRGKWNLQDKMAELKGRMRLDLSWNHEDATWTLDFQFHTFCYRRSMMSLIQVQSLCGQVFQSSRLNTNLSWYTSMKPSRHLWQTAFLSHSWIKNSQMCGCVPFAWCSGRPQDFIIFQKYTMTSQKLHGSNEIKSRKKLSKSNHLKNQSSNDFNFLGSLLDLAPTQILSEL